MASTLTELSFILLQMICVIVVIAYLITRSGAFTEILDKTFTWKNQLILILVFGAVSIYGTESGVDIMGAVVNVRDLGPMVGGLVAGPIVGLGAGLIGGAYRATLDGFTVVPCVLATILAGLFGGTIYLLNKRNFIGAQGAVLFAVGMESLHMALVLLICRPFDQALAIVEQVAIPMILANAAGVFIFAFIIGNLITERQTKAERDSYLSELERKRAELQIAHDIQMSFLPEKLPHMASFDLAATSLPAKEVGGDFYDAIPLPDGRVGLVMADVSGKGVPAALFMALSRTVVRANASVNGSTADTIRNANRLVADDSKSGMFVTLFYGVVDAAARKFTYVNAGHNPPLLFRNGGEPQELKATGIILGVMDDADYYERTIDLADGDLLLFYTDGVTEAIDREKEQFGEERLIATVKECRGLPSSEVAARIQKAVFDFCGAEPQFDDLTLMVLKVDGS